MGLTWQSDCTAGHGQRRLLWRTAGIGAHSGTAATGADAGRRGHHRGHRWQLAVDGIVRLSCAVQQSFRPRWWCDYCIADADERALQVCRRWRRHPGSVGAGTRHAAATGVAGTAQRRHCWLRIGRQPEVRHHPVPGADQLSARTRRRTRQVDPVAVGSAGRAHPLGDPKAIGFPARAARPIGIRHPHPLSRQGARPRAGQRHSASGGE